MEVYELAARRGWLLVELRGQVDGVEVALVHRVAPAEIRRLIASLEGVLAAGAAATESDRVVGRG